MWICIYSEYLKAYSKCPHERFRRQGGCVTGYSVLLANTEPLREKNEYNSLRSRQVDGILAVPTPGTVILDELREQRVKTVIITLEFSGIDCIGVSHRKGGAFVAGHFLERNIERFAYFGPETDDKFLGFRDSLLSAGIEQARIDLIGNQDWWLSTSRRGFQVALEYLGSRSDSQRLGVFSLNDTIALGVVHSSQDLGIAVRDEVGVVGFDDTDLCENSRPTLTSVDQPVEEIGRLAVKLLLKRIEDVSGGPGLQHIQLEPRLVRRETS